MKVAPERRTAVYLACLVLAVVWSALEFVSLGRGSATSDATATGRALAGWVAGRGLVAGRPSAAQDGNVIVVTAATATRYGLRSVADLGSLRALNARMELRGQDPRLVAESWLRAQGLASAGGASH